MGLGPLPWDYIGCGCSHRLEVGRSQKKVQNDDNFDFCKRAAYKVVGMVAATVLAPLGALFGMASNHVSRMKRMGEKSKPL